MPLTSSLLMAHDGSQHDSRLEMGKSITVNAANGTLTSASSTIVLTQDKPITWNNGT